MEKCNEVVSLEYRVNKAFEGKYFIGHTPILTLAGAFNSYGGLVNPKNSGVNLYINTFAVTNYSDFPFRSQLWLNSIPVSGMASPFVSPSNTAMRQLPKPNAYLSYAQNITGMPLNGVSILSRIAGANSTTVGNYYGKIVIPPGGTFLVFMYSPGTKQINAEVAFGWWEEQPAFPCHY